MAPCLVGQCCGPMFQNSQLHSGHVIIVSATVSHQYEVLMEWRLDQVVRSGLSLYICLPCVLLVILHHSLPVLRTQRIIWYTCTPAGYSTNWESAAGPLLLATQRQEQCIPCTSQHKQPLVPTLLAQRQHASSRYNPLLGSTHDPRLWMHVMTWGTFHISLPSALDVVRQHGLDYISVAQTALLPGSPTCRTPGLSAQI